MNNIRKKIFKRTRLVLAVLCVLSLSKIFAPETVKAGVFDNAQTFYQTYGKEMTFQAGTNNQGEIYYATKAKEDKSTGIKYTTIGWQIRVLNSSGALVDTIYYKYGGSNMVCVDTRTVDNYKYKLYKVTLTNIKSRLSQAGKNALNNPGCSIVFDACTTTKIDGVVQGGMTDDGPSWGEVYTTYNGIVNAQDWTDTTKETLKTYYNKTVKGLFYSVTLSKGTGISQVSGAGKYLFGSTVTIQAKALDGYHFSSWSGSGTSSNATYSFTIYGSDVSFTANAAENTYKIVFNSNGGKGSVSSQTLKYSGILTIPASGVTLEGSSLAGWTTSKSVSTVEYTKGNKIAIKDIVQKLKLQGTNGATITLYATWDYGPIIKIDQVFVSLSDASSGKITEEWLAKKAMAIDQEDGDIPYGRGDASSFFMEDYQATDFTEFRSEGSVTETFLAVDSAGNCTRKRIKVYIVDTQMYPAQKVTGNLRFISSKYFKNENGNLLNQEEGGLEKDSIWRLDEEYRGLLEMLFQ